MLNIYEELDDDALRGVLMEVLKVLPGSRQLSIDFLRRRCDAGLRRTMSLSDISTRLSGDDDNPYRISIPVTKKVSLVLPFSPFLPCAPLLFCTLCTSPKNVLKN